MNIIWKGQSCFQITTSSGKDSQVSVFVDPFPENIGLRVPKIEADIMLANKDGDSVAKSVSGNSFLISGPGEYEVKEVFVQGISSSDNSSVIYTIEAEGIRICHLGNFSQKELDPDQIDKIGEIDILMIPVGGGNSISSKEAMKIMSQIEPSIVIPMEYQIPKLKLKLEGLDKFLKTMGIKKIDALPKLSIKKKDIVAEEAKIIVLEP